MKRSLSALTLTLNSNDSPSLCSSPNFYGAYKKALKRWTKDSPCNDCHSSNTHNQFHAIQHTKQGRDQKLLNQNLFVDVHLSNSSYDATREQQRRQQHRRRREKRVVRFPDNPVDHCKTIPSRHDMDVDTKKLVYYDSREMAEMAVAEKIRRQVYVLTVRICHEQALRASHYHPHHQQQQENLLTPYRITSMYRSVIGQHQLEQQQNPKKVVNGLPTMNMVTKNDNGRRYENGKRAAYRTPLLSCTNNKNRVVVAAVAA